LQNRNKDLAIVKAQLLKQQEENKHLAAQGVEVERVIKKEKTLQSKYNALTQAHFKTRNGLKTLQIDFDWLIKNYGKMEVICAQWENIMLELKNICLQ
jgi:hypothetical protein